MKLPHKNLNYIVTSLIIFLILILTVPLIFLIVQKNKQIDYLSSAIKQIPILQEEFEYNCNTVLQKKIIQNSSIISWSLARAKVYIPKSVVISIVNEASRYNNYFTILAIIAVESNFDPYARNGYKKYMVKGLGQINTHIWFSTLKKQNLIERESDIYEISSNIAAINYIINYYLKREKNLKKALFAYSGGSTSYVKKVLLNLKQLNLLKK